MSPCEDAERDIWALPPIEGFRPQPVIKQRFLTSREKIVEILKCPCAQCRRYRNLVKDGRDLLELGNFVSLIFDEAVSLFALLVSLKKAVLIIPFLRQKKFDDVVLASLGQKRTKLAKRVFKDSLNKDSESRKLADDIDHLDNQIEGQWTAFLRPAIAGSRLRYQEFDDRHALPIYDDKPIDTGGSSRVFEFKIHQGYNEISGSRKAGALIRKELAMRDHVEIDTLWELNSLGSPHIARLLASYGHRGSINLVFPKSTTNLRHFLRDPTLQLGQSNFANIFRAPIWSQVIGIVDALRHIHTASDKIRIHFDLKPENILVDVYHDRKFQFMITDFGLTVTKDPSKEGSGQHYGGGDAGYGPPDDEKHPNRSYDIWSMGCIILEILSFTVWSYKGPQKLDEARGSQYLAFWHRKSDEVSIKPAVQSIVDELKNIGTDSKDNPATLSPQNARFARSMVLLVEKMLRVSQIARLTSEQTLRGIKDIVSGEVPFSRETEPEHHADSDGSDDPDTSNDQDSPLPTQRVGLAQPAENETEIGGRILSGLRNIVARPKDYPAKEDEPITLQIFQRTYQGETKLRFVMTPLNDEIPIVYKASRRSLDLVPAYAFRETHDVPRDLAGLRLVQDKDSLMGMSHTLDGELRELRVVHGVLMRQEIVHSTTLTHLTISPYRKLLSLAKKQEKLVLDEDGPITIQLWRQDRKFERECRIVFFVKNSKILVLKFNSSLGLTKEEDNRYSETPILPSYLNKGADSARISLIQGDQDEQPALPIDETLFHRRCLENEQRIASLVMCFESFEERKIFIEKYRRMKKKWTKEMKPA